LIEMKLPSDFSIRFLIATFLATAFYTSGVRAQTVHNIGPGKEPMGQCLKIVYLVYLGM